MGLKIEPPTPSAATEALDAVLVNNVPMQGRGSYGSHAALQHEAMLRALPLLRRAAQEAPSGDRPFTIVEYGSAHGSNSIEPLEAILSLTRHRQVQLLLSDRPENDFNTLAATATDWADARAPVPAGPLQPLFLAMIPRSFYRPVVPARSVDLGFSLSCLHHLDRLPAEPQLYRAQAHHDLCQFLRLRATELVAGGSLVVSLVGQASSGRENYAGPVDACIKAMRHMVDAGTLPPPAAAAFRIPTYNRTLADVQAALDELRYVWKVRELREDAVLHPAIADLRDGQDETASRRYAEIVIDWLMAVCSGYFLKAVRVGSPSHAHAADSLLSEWSRRTKELFLRDHRDEPVFCAYVHILIQRL